MSLSSGARLGSDEIVTLIGAGRMGEVYRARDPKLNRDVALKILPEIFAPDPDRLTRFTREAPVLAALNNVLTVLNVLLKKAVERDVIDRLPCTIRLLPIPKRSAGFYDFDDYERLVAAAKATGRDAYLVVLLGGEAGLRCGEIMALEWGDVDLSKRQRCVQRSEWKGDVTSTRGGRLRGGCKRARLPTPPS